VVKTLAGALFSGEGAIYCGLITAGLVLACFSVYDVISQRKSLTNYWFLFDDRNTYAALWATELGLLAYLWAAPSRWSKIVAYVLTLFFSLLIFISGSLSGVISWLIVLGGSVMLFAWKNLASLFTFSFYRRNWLKLVLGFLFLYFLFPTLALIYPPSDPIAVAENLGQRIRSLVPGQVSQNLRQQRAFFWAAGWEMFKESPVFGVGIGRYYQMSETYLSRPQIQQLASGSSYKHENAHNYFLQIAAETGGVGITLFTGLLLWLFLRKWDFRGRTKNTAAGIAMLALVTMSITGHPLLVQTIFFMTCAVAALMTSPSSTGENTTNDGDAEWGNGGAGERANGCNRTASTHRRPTSNLTLEARPNRNFAVKVLKKIGLPLAAVLLVLYVIHVHSIWNQLPPNFEWGFYGFEGQGKMTARWTRSLALKSIKRGQLRTIYLYAANPDLSARPLHVGIYGNNQLLSEIDLKDEQWHPVELSSPPTLPEQFVLAIKPSRTWRPADYGPPDYRYLGVLVRFE
jgi:O-antigen ligase